LIPLSRGIKSLGSGDLEGSPSLDAGGCMRYIVMRSVVGDKSWGDDRPTRAVDAYQKERMKSLTKRVE
jgi:hypothetical protein